MTTTASEPASGVVVPVADSLFTVGERQALAGFLSGYSGLTRNAYTLDLRQYTTWCSLHGLHLFAAKRVDLESFRGDMETAGRARRHDRPSVMLDRRVLSLRRRRGTAGPFPGRARTSTTAGLRVSCHGPGSE
jgi:hypothetical protein